jgi:hypothetical protein
LAATAAIAQDENVVETEHLIVRWVDGVSLDAIEAAKSDGEGYYAAIAQRLGQEPPAKITIVLDGPAERADGSRAHPHVDAFARILLYQYGPDWRSYFSALAHEMFHVFRFQRRTQADWFFEEGFAEFVALRVDESLGGFPWFDFPVAVVAGQWIASDEDIPLVTMQENHKSINLPCRAQSYTLRSAFLDYLGRTFGDDAVMKMAAEERAGDLDQYVRYFGADLPTLAATWREAALTEYQKLPDAAAQAQRYRKESPIQYIPVCEPGKDF